MTFMKLKLAAVWLVAGTASSNAACNVDGISSALEASLTAMKPVEIALSEPASTEGGVWNIYREGDGRLNTITRSDFGESGRRELRLSIVNRNTYGVADTRIDYLRHAFLEDAGPNGTARRSTVYYYVCDGKLYMPAAEAAMMDMEDYPKEAATALAQIRDHADIAKFTIGLKR
jgi:hypothetical protein